MSTADTQPQLDERIAERFTLKAIVEACLVLEEGIAGVREIDLGLMMGTGMVPGPFARADFRGLDDVLAALERAEEEWGEHFAPPLVLRRLVAQGRLGAKSGQGFYPYPQPEAGYETAPVKLDRRGDDIAVLWLDNPPANSLSPQVIEALEAAWKRGRGHRAGGHHRLAEPDAVLRGRGHQGVHEDRRGRRRATCSHRGHALLRSFEQSRTMTIAAVNGMALGGGCELAMACDVRIAAFSASFGQPEINLGIIPGFGGTQRLPRLVGPAKALEMNTTGDPISAEEAYEYGLVNRVVADHELFDTAMAWARKFARQAPLALEQIKRVSAPGRPGRRHRGREGGLRRRLRLEGRARGHRRVPREADAELPGGGLRRLRRTLAELLRSADRAVALTGAGISVPSGIPDFRTPQTGLWANVDPMEVAHISVFRRDPERFWRFYGSRFAALRDKRPNAAHAALAALERRGLIEAVSPRTSTACTARRAPGPDRGARLDRQLALPGLRRGGGARARRGPRAPRRGA